MNDAPPVTRIRFPCQKLIAPFPFLRLVNSGFVIEGSCRAFSRMPETDWSDIVPGIIEFTGEFLAAVFDKSQRHECSSPWDRGRGVPSYAT